MLVPFELDLELETVFLWHNAHLNLSNHPDAIRSVKNAFHVF